MKHGTNFSTAPEAVAEILTGAALPHAPLAMPKQVLESQSNWLLFFYARLVRRQPRVRQ
ncbi:MAG: hypothetical protein JWN11_2600 [Hyphomicrobiales bacterium]|nr:hypothetical protein [Hyphomicrobiales bacterium]